MTRPVAHLRIGIRQLQEQWEEVMGADCSTLSNPMYELGNPSGEMIWINSCAIPDELVADKIRSLDSGKRLTKDGKTIAANFNSKGNWEDLEDELSGLQAEEYKENLQWVERPWDIFNLNDSVLRTEFDRLCLERQSQPLSETNILIGDKDQLFIEPGARVEASVLNCTTGPIYIGKDAEVMENSAIRGPFAMLDHAAVKMGAKIYGATTLGPHVKVGGELNNVVIQAYSNKGHDGFLGNSVVGEWCNLGADTNSSNLKNNYGPVKAWSYHEEAMIDTGLQFCGLIMGDHSKSGINTMFNTGTVCGVSANVFDGGFPPKHIPSFSWGSGKMTFELEKAFEVANRMMERRGRELTAADLALLKHIFEESESYRK
jgi:UDP-N-acetylglucosamine diphosphorylase/glucosamine-1-phosphate N-acetyltransferase